MALKQVITLSADKTITVGIDPNRPSTKDNPTYFEGYYLGSKKIDSDINKVGYQLLHVFKTPEGSVGVWGKSGLNAQMQAVAPGEWTTIQFTCMLPSTKKGMSASYGYSVMHDDENTMEVPKAVSTSAQSDDYDTDEPDLGDEPEALDAPVSAPVRPPSARPTTPSPAQQAQVKALLGVRR